MLRRTTAILTAALVLGAIAAPAALAKGRDAGRKGGKKPIGSVVSFDGTTLTVTLKDGSSRTATVDGSTQVKIDHRRRPAAKGNPTRGSLEDLVAGTLVLRMKTDDGVLEKVRLRRTAPTPTPTPAPATACGDDDEAETEDEAEGEETETEESDTEVDDSGEAACDDEADEADEEDSEDEDDEDDEEEEEEDPKDVIGEVTDQLPTP